VAERLEDTETLSFLISSLSGLIGLVDLVTQKSLRSDHAIPSKTEAGSSGSNELQPPPRLPFSSGTPFAYLKVAQRFLEIV